MLTCLWGIQRELWQQTWHNRHQMLWGHHLLPSALCTSMAVLWARLSPGSFSLGSNPGSATFYVVTPEQAAKLFHAQFPHLLKGANYNINFLASQGNSNWDHAYVCLAQTGNIVNAQKMYLLGEQPHEHRWWGLNGWVHIPAQVQILTPPPIGQIALDNCLNLCDSVSIPAKRRNRVLMRIKWAIIICNVLGTGPGK